MAKARTPTGDSVTWAPDDPIAWIEREFYIPENAHQPALADFDPQVIYKVNEDGTKQLIVDPRALQLEPYQKAVLRKALTRDADGNFPYSLVLWSDLKKSAKSTIAGAVDAWLAWHHEWESVRVVGNDLKQANSRTFYYIQRAITLNPRLRDVIKSKNYKLETPKHTTIEAIAVDPKGEAGGGDLIVTFTELWAAKNEAAQALWTETTLSPLKYGKSLRWVETYAGFVGASPILEQLYEAGVKHGDRVDVGIDGLELYENKAARMLCLWNTVPRCPWQTDEYYAQEAAVLHPEEYRRIHENAWASATTQFIPIAWWDDCRVDTLPDDGGAWVVGIDAAVTHDCFALVAVSRRGDTCYVRYCNVWTPPPHGKIDYREPEAELRRLARKHNIVCMTYDPTQMEDMAQRLTTDGVSWLMAFPQGSDRLEADKQLYDRIAQKRIQHTGDPTLREHLMNSDADIDAEAHRMRIVHRAPHLPMDAAVALSMACDRATYLNIG